MAERVCPACGERFEGELERCPRDGAALVDPEAAPESAEWPIGDTIGVRYRPKRLIGQGGMARIYLAEDRMFERWVALKFLHFERARDPVLRQRFANEAEAAKAIRHPNVVQVYDYGEARGVPFLVMELAQGSSLAHHLEQHGALAPDPALVVFRQVAAGLEAAHQANVLHRDVKAGNIVLLGEIGAPYGVKVVDFGLARLRGQRLTATGITLGTSEYMAPEQVLAEKADPRTDIYALGILMFVTLSREWPFDRTDKETLLAHQLFTQPPPLSSLVDEVGDDLDLVVATALRKHPDNRYASMTEVRRDLDRVVGMVDGRPDGAPLVVEPDRYEPHTKLGRTAQKLLGGLLGSEDG